MCYNAIISQRIIADAETEPVTLQEAKDWMSVDHDDKNEIITGLITSARRLLERKYGIGIIQKDMRVIINNGCGGQDLPEPPISDVVVKNNDGIVQEVCISGDYDVFIDSPVCNSLTVEYKSGYELEEVPEQYKTAIKQQVLWMFEHLGDEDMTSQLSPMAAMMLSPYKRTTLGLFL